MRAGAGTDNIDVAYCSKNCIFVTNCPGKNSHAVAELALGLMLAVDRRIPDGVQQLKEGQWNKSSFATCKGIKGKTVGLLGLGSISKAVQERLKGFEVNIKVWTRTQHKGLDKQMGFEYISDMKEMLHQCDIVSLHLPSNDKTKGIVNKEFL